MTKTWIAEIGVNHHGDFDKAKRMCSAALDSGATYVKGQFYNPFKVLGKNHPDLNYALRCQFTRKQHEEIASYCEKLGGSYFVSVFDVGDIPWAGSFGKVFKIASRMNNNREFIAKVEQQKKLTFASVQPWTQIMPERFKLMWCVRAYPTPLAEIKKYPYDYIGLSSHCPDPEAIRYAGSKGASVIEAHLCESREEEGCDIRSSLTIEEFRMLTR